jgi:hypothetical protein
MAQTIQELMGQLPPVDYTYKQDVFAPMRDFFQQAQAQPPVDLAPFFQQMQQANQGRPTPQVEVPGEVGPLQSFFSLLGGNLAGIQSGNQQFSQGPLQTLQGRAGERREAQQTNEQMKLQAQQDEFEQARMLKMKMHEMQMMDAIKRGDLKTAQAENEARFKMLDLARQEDARIAQEKETRDLMGKTIAQIEIEKVKGQEREEVERVKGEVKKGLKDAVAALPKEGQIELQQTLQGIRSTYSAQAALGLPIDNAEMEKEMEAAANKIIAKHKAKPAAAGTAAPADTTTSKADLVRARARELAAQKGKK